MKKDGACVGVPSCLRRPELYGAEFARAGEFRHRPPSTHCALHASNLESSACGGKRRSTRSLSRRCNHADPKVDVVRIFAPWQWIYQGFSWYWLCFL